jgi:uncharacterized membrane protein YadS
MTEITHHVPRKNDIALFVPGLLLSAVIAGLALWLGNIPSVAGAGLAR